MQKVLLITYYWPPAGGPGVQRWLNFVKYLRDFDIEPVVFVPKNPHYPIRDASFEVEVPKGITILKKSIIEPYAWASLFSKKETETISSGIIKDQKQQGLLQKSMLWVRGNLFIPDARKFWVPPSIKFLSGYLSENNVKTIITTGPPHSLHLIGLGLKKKLNINWIADFRDPWTAIGYHKQLKLTNASEKKHKKLEREVLCKADHILTTSYITKKDFEKITAKPITVITNGFDGEISKENKFDNKFSLAHIGSLLSERNPENLWKALYELTEGRKDFREDFELKLVGKVSEKVLLSIEKYNLSDYLSNIGYVTHSQSIDFQKKSQILLLLEIDKQEMRGIIPGKIFEYLKAKRPILAIGPEQWDATKILKKTKAGKFFNYTEKEEIKKQILQWYAEFKNGKLTVNSSSAEIEKFKRKNLTSQLSEVIKQYR
jgi:hypothetical protein